ncbi:MAG: DUF3489 domain-containing protein [Beijerinckiaceae bacterium]
MSKVIRNTATPQASPKLSAPQRKILQNASRRSDLLVVIRKGHELEARSPVSALIRRGFLAETAVGNEQPAWKRGSDGSAIGLRITPSGFQAIGRNPGVSGSSEQRGVSQSDPLASQKDPQSSTKREADWDQYQSSSNDAPDRVKSSSLHLKNVANQHARHGSKRALIIDLLHRGEGVRLAELEAATGWLPHTTRAALTSLRKSGFVLEKSKSNGGTTLYRIVAEPAAGSHAAADPAQRAA